MDEQEAPAPTPGATTNGNAEAPAPSEGATANGKGPAPAAPATPVTLEEYLLMDDASKAALPRSRVKKLEKQAMAKKKKESKAAANAAAAAGKKDFAKGPSKSSEKKRKKAEAQAAGDAASAFVDTTPPGEFKRLAPEMAATYQPRAVESSWYTWWEKQGYFHPSPGDAKGKPADARFVMVLPPPNVTGSLHLGHALMCAIEDAVTRYNRMHGKVTLWLPGVDHAGIATQVVVEKQLARTRGVDRHALGREKFVEEVWKWKEEYGGKIVNQLRRIGSSMDWKREEFTMSDKLNNAVKEAFVRFYDDGLLYRTNRLVNWSCSLRTAISNIEVDNIEIEAYTMRKVPGYEEEVEFGVMAHFAYKVEGTEEELVVATTRLETMLGDTAVAVHPDDERYKHLIGKMLKHPLVDRRIPIIGDGELVDKEVGTGAVKVTPAHDPKDFLCGRRNNLPEITIFTDDGDINENGGEFRGMKRYRARVEVQKKLDGMGLFRGKTPKAGSLPICSRSGDVVEDMLKPQWYVKCKELATRSADAARSGELEIVPDSHKATWYNWLDNIQDWCVSRQLWWGHRIPAYKATVAGSASEEEKAKSPATDVWVVGRSEDEARERASKEMGIDANHISLEQDEDVLDTWFSSGLFPFSVFGWPEKTDEMEAFYPTTMLETGHDILFFWVARMVMMGLGLTGKLPFKTILLHPLVRDKRGEKMSKSKGNVIDPLEVINGATLEALAKKLEDSNLPKKEVAKAIAGQKEDYPGGIPECGADSLRIGLLAYMSQAGDINLDVQRVIGYRNFGNKLWNATRFAISNLGKDFQFSSEGLAKAVSRGSPLDLWALSRLNAAVQGVNEMFDAHKIGEAVLVAYKFWMNELCAIYLEGLKPIMRGDDAEAKTASQMVLYECLNAGLRILHPLMPYVTEELFQRLPGNNIAESIMIAPFPVGKDERHFAEAEDVIGCTMRNVQALRFVKADFDLKASVKPAAFIVAATKAGAGKIVASIVETLTPVKRATVVVAGEGDVPARAAAKMVDDVYEVHVVLDDVIDVKVEVGKLEASLVQKNLRVEELNKKMAAKGYERVPEKVRGQNRAALEKQMAEIEKIGALAERFRQMMGDGMGDSA